MRVHLMPFEPDTLFARRSLKRQLFVWRVIGVVALVATVVVTIGRLNGGLTYKRDYLARYTVDGTVSYTHLTLPTILLV